MVEREGNRYVATTLEGFIQQLAVSYVRNGYVFYVTGRVPEGKDPGAVDRKLVAKYDLGISKWARARRKCAGYANVQYLRFETSFVILATAGVHTFFEEEATLVRDCRRVPIKFGGYSVSYRDGHASVRIEREQYLLLKAYFLGLATHRSAETLAQMLRGLPFEPYAPIRRQLFGILGAVNRARKSAGYDPVPPTCLRLKRRIVRPFAAAGPSGWGAPNRTRLCPSERIGDTGGGLRPRGGR